MRKGKIISYYEYDKVAYFIFLPEFHMWWAASWHVRSGCINHVILHYIICAGWWKPLMGQTGDWRNDFFCSLNGGKRVGEREKTYVKHRIFFFFLEQMASPPTIRWSQIGLGIQTSSDGLLFHNAVKNLRWKNVLALGGNNFQFRVGKIFDVLQFLGGESSLDFCRIWWI